MDATAVTDDVHGTQPALIPGLERSIAAAVAGDAAAFTALIDTRLARTYRIAVAILARRPTPMTPCRMPGSLPGAGYPA